MDIGNLFRLLEISRQAHKILVEAFKETVENYIAENGSIRLEDRYDWSNISLLGHDGWYDLNEVFIDNEGTICIRASEAGTDDGKYVFGICDWQDDDYILPNIMYIIRESLVKKTE